MKALSIISIGTPSELIPITQYTIPSFADDDNAEMKIIGVLEELSNGAGGFELDRRPSIRDTEKFHQWAEQHNISGQVSIDLYYTAEMFGDIDHWYIRLADAAPESVRTLCLLRWT